MPKRAPTHRPKGQPTRKDANAAYDRRRATDEVRKLYQTPQWRALRKFILDRDPYCKRCDGRGIVTPSTVANHITKARDDLTRFFDPNNLEGVCKPCHDSDIQSEERRNSVNN